MIIIKMGKLFAFLLSSIAIVLLSPSLFWMASSFTNAKIKIIKINIYSKIVEMAKKNEKSVI